jgi:hypothetical protein
MSHRFRAALVGLAVAFVLAPAGQSGTAAFNSPRLFASQPEQANRVTLLYTQSTADDPVARIVHYVPVPYRTNLDATVSGPVGSATLRGTPAEQLGDNAATSPADTMFSANGRQARIGDAVAGCLGRPLGETGRYLVLRLRDAGNDVAWDVPAYVERMTAATDFGADATISVCFGPSDVPAANPSRTPGDFDVRELELRFTRFFTSPKRGLQRWSTLVTPYQARTGRVNDAGTVELQSAIVYPRSVSLASPVRTRLTAGTATFRFTGNVVTAAAERPRVSLFRGFNRTSVGSSSAQASPIRVGAGRFTKVHTVKRAAAPQTFWFQVRAYVQNAVQGRAGCDDAYHTEVQCIQATRAGYMVRSRSVMVRVPGL